MPEETALDRAHAAMQGAPDDDAARLRFHERLLDAELFLLLETEAEGDTVTPETFPVDGTDHVLVFDREERLAGFVGRIAPYAAMSGRRVVAMLAGQGIGLGVNLGAGPFETLLPPESIDWLAEMLSNRPARIQALPKQVTPPTGLPETLLTALDAKLASAAGLASVAWLVSVSYGDGNEGRMLAFIDAAPGAESALAQAVAEALAFSGVAAGSMDVAFLIASDPLTLRLARVGLRFDLPAPHRTGAAHPAAPGMDPDKPPKLR